MTTLVHTLRKRLDKLLLDPESKPREIGIMTRALVGADTLAPGSTDQRRPIQSSQRRLQVLGLSSLTDLDGQATTRTDEAMTRLAREKLEGTGGKVNLEDVARAMAGQAKHKKSKREQDTR